jgi:amidohydrolase family protein
MPQAIVSRLTWVGAFGGLAALAACGPVMHGDVLLSNVSVIDVRSGQALPERDVVIDDSVIAAVVPHGSRRVSARAVVDGRGRFVIPGLWDMHGHIRSYDPGDILPMFIRYGVTGIRDLGLTRFATIQQWRGEIAQGTLIGPRIISSGVIIEGGAPVFASSISITHSAEIAPKLDTLIAQGIGVVKLFDDVPGPVFTDVIAYARSKGLPTAGHIPEDWTQIQAAETGLGSIEHFYGLSKSLSFQNGQPDSAEVNRLAAALTANHTYECPTLVNNTYDLNMARLAEHPELGAEIFPADSALASTPAYFRAWWARIRQADSAERKPEGTQETRTWAALTRAALRPLAARGVKFLAGTDTPNSYLLTGSSLHDELALFVEAGMTPAEALRTATLYPAEYFGRVDEGVVAEGHLADLVVLDRNPLERIEYTRAIHAVVANGRLFSYQDLAAIERDQRQRVAGHSARDFDQVVYMQLRRSGVAGARKKFPDPLHDSAMVVRAEHLLHLSASLLRAGEIDAARQVLEWNHELFPGDEATRAGLDSLTVAGR